MKRIVAIAATVASSSPVSADPLRLRADAFASAASPAGLLVLDADSTPTSTLSAEAVVWMAGQRGLGEDVTGDVLVMALRVRDDEGRVNAQVGRFVSSLGALRPVHVDGATARARLPRRFDIEAMAGIPVIATDVSGSRAWDWVVGGRVARRLGDYGSVGVAYQQQRDAGRLATEELGVDAGMAFTPKHDAGARFAYDLAGGGIAEIGATASARYGPVRTELYARHREASHLLPATSLFTVLGDTPSQRAGTVVTWKAAPRLDVIADLAARRAVDELGEDVAVRGRLRLDDKGKSVVGCELHRSGGDAAWTGARATAQLVLPRSFGLMTELELVIPDEDRGRGVVWPWALVAATYKTHGWEAAIALEASATPEYRHRLDAVLQVARLWSVK